MSSINAAEGGWTLQDLPTGPEHATSRTVLRAIHIAGGAERLARFLHLHERDVVAWSQGKRHTPPRVYLALLDLVAANELSPAASAVLRRRADPRWRGPERRRVNG